MDTIVYEEYGSPEVLQLATRAEPAPSAREILVRVRAAEITKADCELRAFQFPVKWFAFPLRIFMGIRRPRRHVLGGYFSGTVEAVGKEVTRHHVGDEVYGGANLRMGAYGQFAVYPETYSITRKPANMSFEEAAAVPLGGLNALHFIRASDLRAAERILINGAGGSIGLFALQIAKSRGAYVIAVDAPHKESMLRDLGADEFIDYTSTPFADRVSDVDVVLDIVAGSSLKQCLSVLTKRGRYLSANPTLSKMFGCLWTSLFSPRKASFAFAGESLEELQALRDMIQAGSVVAPLDQVFAPAEVQEAHRRVESEERIGVVVLSRS